MVNFQHAKFWHYDGNHSSGRDCVRYDPHGFGLDLISTMAYVAQDWDENYGRPDSEIGQILEQHGGDLSGVIVKHHRGDGFGHQVHVAAMPEQWEALRLANQIFIDGHESQLR